MAEARSQEGAAAAREAMVYGEKMGHGGEDGLSLVHAAVV